MFKEIEDIFKDTFDGNHKGSINKTNLGQIKLPIGEEYDDLLFCSIGEDNLVSMDPPERYTLPYLRDPKKKISFWTILKDSIGKDITKLSVPVYFNDPTNILQKCAVSMEYSNLIDVAIDQEDPFMRLAYVAAFSITFITILERNNTKPFNPLLGETYEYKCNSFEFLAEQVSHHPPISAYYCHGFKGYKIYGCNRAKTKFNGKNIKMHQIYRVYVEIEKY